jgi:type I pantothenate kinase
MVATPIDAAALAELVLAHGRRPLLVGLTGSVAVGKTWLARALVEALVETLAPVMRTDSVSTDGFLFPNAVLEARGLVLRKGFPESYDADAMLASFAALRTGAAAVPVHSHVTYDIDPALVRTVGPADIILVEGLGLSGFPDGRSARDGLDLLIYLDADPADIEAWYVARFLALWRAGADDPASFYHRFAPLPEADVVTLARGTWNTINRPNLENHIGRARDTADILLRKDAGHRLLLIKA